MAVTKIDKALKNEAKEFIIERTDIINEVLLISRELIRKAVKDIIVVSRKYRITPSRFKFSANRELEREVDNIIDKLLADILDTMERAVSYEIEDENKRKTIIAWMYLSYKGFTIRTRLESYLHEMLLQLQPQVASLLAQRDFSASRAADIITLHLNNVMLSRFYEFAAKNKYPGAKLSSGIGIYKNAYNKLTRAISDQVARTRQRVYYDINHPYTQFWQIIRGSSYPCSLCDSQCGITSSRLELPPFHPHCCCIAIPLT